MNDVRAELQRRVLATSDLIAKSEHAAGANQLPSLRANIRSLRKLLRRQQAEMEEFDGPRDVSGMYGEEK